MPSSSPLDFDPRRFRTTVPFYARYRVPYPPALIAEVAQRAGLEPGEAVLDLGCGPGILALAFARLGYTVTGIDPEPEMLDAARAAAEGESIAVDFAQGSSYDLSAAPGPFGLVTMGRSFHWMDRQATLAELDKRVRPGGAVALVHDRRVRTVPDWKGLARDLADRFGLNDTHRKWRQDADWPTHEEVLLASPFSRVESVAHILSRTLGADEIVGRTFSLSVSAPQRLGDRKSAFEAELRHGLAALSPDDRFTEIVSVEAVLAFRS